MAARALVPAVTSLWLLASIPAFGGQQRGPPNASGSAARPAPTSQTSPDRTVDADAKPTIGITSPNGRTGIVTSVRIVAQVVIPPSATLSPLEFYVDGKLVGTVASGPPYSVDWTDENPFEKRELVVQASDAA